jgi:hypothetical protein
MSDQRPDARSAARLARLASGHSDRPAARVRLQGRRRAIAAAAVTTAVAAVVIIPPVFLETSPTTRCEQHQPVGDGQAGDETTPAPRPAQSSYPSPPSDDDCLDDQAEP